MIHKKSWNCLGRHKPRLANVFLTQFAINWTWYNSRSNITLCLWCRLQTNQHIIVLGRKKKQKCRRNKSSALELCQFSFRFHLLSWWRSQEVDWSVNYNLDLMFCLRAHAGRQRVTINQLLTASSGSGWGLWCSWSQGCVKGNDDLRAAADETVSWSHYSVIGHLDKSGAIVRRAGLSPALDDESDTVSARSSFPASVLPTDRLFASPSPSGSLVRALGRTLSRLGWGWTSICCFRVSSMILFTYFVMKYHVISFRLYWFFCIFDVFLKESVGVAHPQRGTQWRCCLSDKQCLRPGKSPDPLCSCGQPLLFYHKRQFHYHVSYSLSRISLLCSETILHAMDWPSSCSSS